MKAGRVLDEMVAEKVMGLPNAEWKAGLRSEGKDAKYWACPPYSTNIAASWEVVEKLQSFDFMVKVWSPNHDTHEEGTYQGLKRGEWECTMWKWFDRVTGRIVPPFDNAPDPYGQNVRRTHAETVPHAICLTALKIIGIDAE